LRLPSETRRKYSPSKVGC